MERVRIIGSGRAGRALGSALGRRGWEVVGYLGRGDTIGDAATGVDILVIATPDAAVAEVAAGVTPVAGTTVVHLSGAMGPDVLAPHDQRAAVHPLVSLPDAARGADLLTSGAWFAVAGAAPAERIVEALGGRTVRVADGDRAGYHAAAAVASNHLVALLGQVERLAAQVGVPLEAFLDLAAGSLDNVRAMGPAAALTGPAARGDDATIAAHLEALPDDERSTYLALCEAARRLSRERR